MPQFVSYIALIAIIGMMLVTVACALSSKDRTKIWSPIMFVNVYLAYYLILPFFKDDSLAFGQPLDGALPYLFLGGVVSLGAIYIGFNFRLERCIFKKYNEYFNCGNSLKIGVWLFVVGFVSYVLFNGFRLSVFSNSSYAPAAFDPNASYGHTDTYITNLISLFCTSVCLLYVARKNKSKQWLIVVASALALSIYLIEGFRFRILVLVVAFLVFYYLYPTVKKVNYMKLLLIGAVVYVGMNIVEMTRNYGHGLDLKRMQNIDAEDLNRGAAENRFVYEFSALVMERYSGKERIYFEPITTAICMPIPRAIFPDKPKGLYLREANMAVLHTLEYGAAFLYFVEAYLAFGWAGIIFQGLFIGFLSRIFWDNYQRNRESIGAILLLALYNGVLYVIISRGYLAQVFTTYMYFVIIPFWLSKFIIAVTRKT